MSGRHSSVSSRSSRRHPESLVRRRSSRRHHPNMNQLRDPRQGPSSTSHEGPTYTEDSHEYTHESSRPLVTTGNSTESAAIPFGLKTPGGRSVKSRRPGRRRGGKFQRNQVGLEIFEDPIIEEDVPSTIITDDREYSEVADDGHRVPGHPRRPGTDAIRRAFKESGVGRAVEGFLYLPVRSKTHVTVSYIPARSKPDGTIVNPPWYAHRPPPPIKEHTVGLNETVVDIVPPSHGEIAKRRLKAMVGISTSTRRHARRRRSAVFTPPQRTSVLRMVETSPARRRSTFITQDDLLAGQPIQLLNETEGPRTVIAPEATREEESELGLPPGVNLPGSAWFTP